VGTTADEPVEEAERGAEPRRRVRRGRPIAGDRRCATCGTKLSVYNAGPHCWQHTIGWPWRGPEAKPGY
jgi:hypothetical protein